MATLSYIRQLEQKRGLFFQIGLTLALLITWIALQISFTYTLPDLRVTEPEPEQIIFEVPAIKNSPTTVPVKPIINKQPVTPNPVTIPEPQVTEKPLDIITPDNTDPVTVTTAENTTVPEFIPPVMPEFIGGMEALYRYLQNHLKYDRRAIREGISGTVYLNFRIDEEGNISEVKVLKGVHPLLDNEAIRVVSMMPRWQPGKNYDGSPVSCLFNLPVTFRLK